MRTLIEEFFCSYYTPKSKFLKGKLLKKITDDLHITIARYKCMITHLTYCMESVIVSQIDHSRLLEEVPVKGTNCSTEQLMITLVCKG